MAEAKDNEAIQIDPVMPDKNGITPLGIACDKQSNRIVQKVMMFLSGERKWMTANDLIKLSRSFPTLIAPSVRLDPCTTVAPHLSRPHAVGGLCVFLCVSV